jgi:hypothetical protein
MGIVFLLFDGLAGRADACGHRSDGFTDCGTDRIGPRSHGGVIIVCADAANRIVPPKDGMQHARNSNPERCKYRNINTC